MSWLRMGMLGTGLLVAAWACDDGDDGGAAGAAGAVTAGRGGSGAGTGGAGSGGVGVGGVGGSSALCQSIFGGRAGAPSCLACDGFACDPGDTCVAVRSRCDCVSGEFTCSEGQAGNAGSAGATDDGEADSGVVDSGVDGGE